MTEFQTVETRGALLGLPTFPSRPPFTGLTALVTGANGMSGYHMVKVLAASPERWTRIYCLSRRPPPENFFDDLGNGASRVKHISVDFLSEPSHIANQLKSNIQKIDHVFFFSYMQTQQKGDILGMWSDATALAEVNEKLMRNFLAGLKSAGLQPRRFLLQTGAKNYGFHIGPATNPSFESDSRVTLEDNFYYPQEDALTEYCDETGSAWNIVRPSFIIGAVRDSALNLTIGLATYAAVQSHLSRSLDFPGDYAAWDREFCQSTALLNAHFEEWAVLTEAAANEAFNIQDGQNFTWGRFWPYLSSWYSITWNPPSEDHSRYRETRCRYKDTPRGYGPTGTTRSILSFLEWSERADVQNAFEELKVKYGIVLDPFAGQNRAQIFGMVDSAILGDWPLSLSMRKARKLGFFGTTDSYGSFFRAMHDLAKLKLVVPPTKDEYIE